MSFFDPVLQALAWVLALFYAAVPNLGVAIILLTFAIMLALYPLTAKQARSMIAMQMVQPEIKRIQAKYKHDRAKLNEEMMKFYQENKINPLAGCLPLLVQMPIFFALFRVLRNPYQYVPTSSKLYSALCTLPRGGSPVSVARCAKPPLPIHQSFLGIDLSVAAPSQVGTWATFAAFSLVLMVMLTGFMQSRQAAKRTPAVNKQMAAITKILPVFFGFISLRFPAGLVLYFFVSNLWRLGQQEVIFRRYGSAAAPKHRSIANASKAAIVDVDSREHTDDDMEQGEPPEESPKALSPPKTTSGTKPAPGKAPGKAVEKSTTAPNGAKPIAPPNPTRGGGLRSLFKLPPPPGQAPSPKAGSGSSKPPATKKPSSGSTGSTGSRPGETGRRTSKKKRKR